MSSRQKAIYIVCSPRQRVGKTLVARALTEFILADGRAAIAFDLNPNNTALYGFLPRNTARADSQRLAAELAEGSRRFAQLEADLAAFRGDAARQLQAAGERESALLATLQQIYASTSWRTLSRWWRFKAKLLGR